MRLEHRLELAATELAFIAGFYPAMALNAPDPRGRVREVAAGAAFVGWAWAGLVLRSRRLLAGGLVAHAAWDLAHHVADPGARAPDWYPPFCMLADILLALRLLGSGKPSPLGM